MIAFGVGGNDLEGNINESLSNASILQRVRPLLFTAHEVHPFEIFFYTLTSLTKPLQ
jgi:hypothetical protein